MTITATSQRYTKQHQGGVCYTDLWMRLLGAKDHQGGLWFATMDTLLNEPEWPNIDPIPIVKKASEVLEEHFIKNPESPDTQDLGRILVSMVEKIPEPDLELEAMGVICQNAHNASKWLFFDFCKEWSDVGELYHPVAPKKNYKQ